MLDRLLEATRTDPDLHAWFTQALDDYRDGMPLECALGLAGPRAIRQRDAAVRRLADLIDPSGTMRPWPLAGRIEKAIRSFDRMHNRDSLLAKTIGEIIEIESRPGIRPARSQRKIFDIITA